MSEENQFEVNPYTAPRSSDSEGSTWVNSGGKSLRKVAQGIKLVYYGIVLMLVAIILVVLAMILSNLLESLAILAVGGIAAAALLVVAAILNFVGPIVCLAVPAETRSKGLITGSVIFQLLNLVVGIFVQVAQRLEAIAASWLVTAQLGSSMIGATAFILFILFIKRLAQFIGRDDLAQRAGTVLNTWILLFILLMAGTIVLAVAPLGALFILLPAAVAAIIVLVVYVKLIESMKNALASKSSNSRDQLLASFRNR